MEEIQFKRRVQSIRQRVGEMIIGTSAETFAMGILQELRKVGLFKYPLCFKNIVHIAVYKRLAMTLQDPGNLIPLHSIL